MQENGFLQKDNSEYSVIDFLRPLLQVNGFLQKDNSEYSVIDFSWDLYVFVLLMNSSCMLTIYILVMAST